MIERTEILEIKNIIVPYEKRKLEIYNNYRTQINNLQAFSEKLSRFNPVRLFVKIPLYRKKQKLNMEVISEIFLKNKNLDLNNFESFKNNFLIHFKNFSSEIILTEEELVFIWAFLTNIFKKYEYNNTLARDFLILQNIDDEFSRIISKQLELLSNLQKLIGYIVDQKPYQEINVYIESNIKNLNRESRIFTSLDFKMEGRLSLGEAYSIVYETGLVFIEPVISEVLPIYDKTLKMVDKENQPRVSEIVSFLKKKFSGIVKTPSIFSSKDRFVIIISESENPNKSGSGSNQVIPIIMDLFNNLDIKHIGFEKLNTHVDMRHDSGYEQIIDDPMFSEYPVSDCALFSARELISEILYLHYIVIHMRKIKENYLVRFSRSIQLGINDHKKTMDNLKEYFFQKDDDIVIETYNIINTMYDKILSLDVEKLNTKVIEKIYKACVSNILKLIPKKRVSSFDKLKWKLENDKNALKRYKEVIVKYKLFFNKNLKITLEELDKMFHEFVWDIADNLGTRVGVELVNEYMKKYKVNFTVVVYRNECIKSLQKHFEESEINSIVLESSGITLAKDKLGSGKA